MSAGKAPPKPPPVSRLGLTEVERAMSVLEGRHPEHERLQRQTREAIEERRGRLEVELEKNARARTKRRIALAAVLGVAAAAGAVAWKLGVRANALRVAVEGTQEPWLARGFTPVTSNELTTKRTLEAELPAASCFVAVATSDATVRVATPDGTTVAPRSVAWCSCDAQHVTVDTPPRAEGETGLAVLRVPAATLGGPLARSTIEFTPGAWGDGGRECADATLDAWIDGRRGAAPVPGLAQAAGPILDSKPQRAALGRAGLRPIALLEASRHFAVVDVPAGSCALALAATPDVALSLRVPGGARPVAGAKGALAWCSAQAGVVSVWRDGKAPVAVLAVPAARIGGLAGLRECAEDAGVALPPEATWLGHDDLAFDADALLRASGAVDVTSAPLRVDPGSPDGRVIALSLAPGASVVSEPEGVVVACEPPLAASSRWAVCAQSAPAAWFDRTDAPAGAARGTLPVWLTTLEGRKELDAIARVPELLALTRRLVREGFEPTALEGVTELADGVRVVGRASEDAVVAVGLVPARPWVLPYTDGIPWDLGDAPRVVKLAPGDSVKLTASPIPALPLSARRTVVFRHVAP